MPTGSSWSPPTAPGRPAATGPASGTPPPRAATSAAARVDDVAYLAGLIDAIKADYAVDDKRVYLFGHSNGGFMSYRMAHEHGGAIAAIASLAGADQSRSRPAPPEPVHVLQIHGTADTVIPYEGGSLRGEAVPGAKAGVENWAAHNGCAAAGVDSGALDLDGGLDGRETDVRRYTDGCRPGGSAGTLDHRRRRARAGALGAVHPAGRRVAAGASEAVTGAAAPAADPRRVPRACRLPVDGAPQGGGQRRRPQRRSEGPGRARRRMEAGVPPR